VADFKNMNGVVLSSDEKTLYANHKDGEYILAFDVQPDGSLKNQRNFGKYKSVTTPGAADPRLAEDNGADGMAIDDAGRIYTATNVGVEVFSPKGEYLGAIPIGLWGAEQNRIEKPQNLTFAGPRQKVAVYRRVQRDLPRAAARSGHQESGKVDRRQPETRVTEGKPC
jgi:gluconolactonase